MTEPTDKDIELVKRVLNSQDVYQQELEVKEYDGISGMPPSWVPNPVTEQFRRNRDTMLHTWGYEPAEAKAWLDRYGSIGDEKSDWFYPAKYPCGRDLEPEYFREVIGLLANIRWAVSLGTAEGLKKLAGDRASQGYALHEASKAPKRDTLRVLMERTFLALIEEEDRNPTTREVINSLTRFDEDDGWHEVIEEIDYEEKKGLLGGPER